MESAISSTPQFFQLSAYSFASFVIVNANIMNRSRGLFLLPKQRWMLKLLQFFDKIANIDSRPLHIPDPTLAQVTSLKWSHRFWCWHFLSFHWNWDQSSPLSIPSTTGECQMISIDRISTTLEASGTESHRCRLHRCRIESIPYLPYQPRLSWLHCRFIPGRKEQVGLVGGETIPVLPKEDVSGM